MQWSACFIGCRRLHRVQIDLLDIQGGTHEHETHTFFNNFIKKISIASGFDSMMVKMTEHLFLNFEMVSLFEEVYEF